MILADGHFHCVCKLHCCDMDTRTMSSEACASGEWPFSLAAAGIAACALTVGWIV